MRVWRFDVFYGRCRRRPASQAHFQLQLQQRCRARLRDLCEQHERCLAARAARRRCRWRDVGGVTENGERCVHDERPGCRRYDCHLRIGNNDNGEYKIDFLPAGRYDIKASGSGFGDATSENVELLVGNTNNLEFILNPSGVTGTVTVTSGETELISKEKTDISMNITPRDIQDLPLNGRDLANLAYLAPGVKPVDSYDPTKNRIAIFGINGSSGRNVNVTVNGIDNKDNTVGGPVMQFPLEAIQEFVISTLRHVW